MHHGSTYDDRRPGTGSADGAERAKVIELQSHVVGRNWTDDGEMTQINVR